MNYWAVVLGAVLAGASGLAAGEVRVAGLQPDRRPEGAPRIVKHLPPPGWRARAEKGIERPLPAGLEFLDRQGAWYTPFDRPGMTPPYDIRHLHSNLP